MPPEAKLPLTPGIQAGIRNSNAQRLRGVSVAGVRAYASCRTARRTSSPVGTQVTGSAASAVRDLLATGVKRVAGSVLFEPYPNASGYLKQFERLGGRI